MFQVIKEVFKMRIVFSLIFIFCSLFAFSQKVKVLSKPVEYLRPSGEVLKNHESRIPRKGGIQWSVFSDRDNNTVYESANKANPIGSIGFGEIYYVTDIEESPEGDWLELYSIESGKAKTRIGFIEASKVLLWNTAIRNQGFTVKVLAMITDINVLIDASSYLSKEGEGSVFCYSRPDHDKKFMNDKKLSLFQLMFKLKEENGMYLLAYDNSFSSYSSDVVLGWVPREVVQEWEYRLTIEPNYSDEARTQRSIKEVKLPVFKQDKFEAATEFVKTGKASQEDVFEFKKEYDETLSEEMRMPLLDGAKGYDTKNSLFHVGYISPVLSKGNKNVLDKRDKDKMIDDFYKKIEPYSNVNFTFVVDGSSTMKASMGDIKRAIQNIKVDISDELKEEFSFAFSCVVYRANEDGKCGSNLTSKLDFTPKVNKVYDWIDAEMAKPNCSTFKPNQGSALRAGLYESLKMIQNSGRSGQSNYVILIGGPGDESVDTDDPKLNIESLAKLYAENGVNMFAYQYLSGQDRVYNYFFDDLTDLSEKGMEELYKTIAEVAEREEIEKFKFVRSTNNSLRRYIADTNSTGFMRFSEINAPANSNRLDGEFFLRDMNNLINRITRFQINKVSPFLDQINGFLSTENEFKLDASLALMLRGTEGGNASELMDFFRGTNFQYIAPAWVPKSTKVLKNDLYKRALFFTNAELSDLKADLKSFSSGSDDPEVFRKSAHKACKNLVVKYIGDIDDGEQISGSLLFEKFTGVSPTPMNVFSGIKDIDDILNSRVVSQTTLEQLRKSADKWYEDLETVETNEKFQWRRGKVVYFWVPEVVFSTNKTID